MSISISGSGGSAPTPDRTMRQQPVKPRESQKAFDFVMVLAGQAGIPTARLASADQPVAGRLHGTQAGRFQDGFDVDAAGQRFNLVPSTAGHAVAFDARPVVGPAAMALGFASKGFAPLANGGATVRPKSGTHHQGTMLGGVTSMSVLASGLMAIPSLHSGQRPTGPVARTSPAKPVPVAARHEPTAQVCGQSSDTPDAAFELVVDAATEGDGRVSSGRGLDWQAQNATRTQMLASLLASAEDYRVFVRGVMLDPREERGLAKAVRAVLREYGFPDRPVIIAATAREI